MVGKEAFASATLRAYPKPNALTSIMYEASDMAVGAALQQNIKDQWCPNAYFSKQLQPRQTQYSTFDRELLAIYLLIKHCRHFIEGGQFSSTPITSPSPTLS